MNHGFDGYGKPFGKGTVGAFSSSSFFFSGRDKTSSQHGRNKTRKKKTRYDQTFFLHVWHELFYGFFAGVVSAGTV